MGTLNNETLERWEETFLYIKGFAVARNMKNTLIALSVARKYHDGAFRKGGEPFIIHPLSVARLVIQLEVLKPGTFEKLDILCAAALIHDVIEDCKDFLPEELKHKLINEHNLHEEVVEFAYILTKKPGCSESIYYEGISASKEASILKILDRFNNCSTMEAFEKLRMIKYIKENKEVIYPLCAHIKKWYPEFSRCVTICKFMITSVSETIAALYNVENFIQKDQHNYRKTYEFIKGYARGKDMKSTLVSLPLAVQYHQGQTRELGDSFVTHPLRVCSYLIALGIEDDVICSAALLHEIIKKCNLPGNGIEIVEKYKISREVLDLIQLMSNIENYPLSEYYKNLKSSPEAILIRLSNRANTCATLFLCSREEKERYIEENNVFISSLANYGIDFYPEYSIQMQIMLNQISSLSSLVNSIISREDYQDSQKINLP